jgi:hypothetical protein
MKTAKIISQDEEGFDLKIQSEQRTLENALDQDDCSKLKILGNDIR